MSDASRVQILVEGDDDRAVLTGLMNAGLLPPEVEFRRASAGGNHPVVIAAVARARVGVSSVAMLDLDDRTIDALVEWVARAAQGELADAGVVSAPPSGAERVRAVAVRVGSRDARIVVLPVGLALGDETCTAYGVESFAIDDYLLRLVREQAVFEAVSEVNAVPHATAIRKLDAALALLRSNGGHALRIISSKRVLFVLRAIADFRAASATFAGRLIDVARQRMQREELRAAFSPLLADLEAAITACRNPGGA